MSMDRRRFLRLSAAGALGGLAGAACGADAGYDPQALSQPELLAILGPDTVREIGLRYRETVPAENDADALRAAIRTAHTWTSAFRWAPDPSLAERVRADFTDGRTVLVQGWVLSLTEARQAALFSLLSS